MGHTPEDMGQPRKKRKAAMKPTPAAKIKGRALEPQQEDEGLEEEVGVLELEGFLEFLAMGEFKQRRRGSPA